jgi:hypothetical protein
MSTLTEQDPHREYGYLAMKDGTRLAYIVSSPRKDGKYPTIPNYSTYQQSGMPFSDVKRFLGHRR